MILIVRYKMKHTCRVVCSNLGANRSQMFYFSRAILVLTIEAGLWCFAEVKQYWLIGVSMDITCNAKVLNHWLRSLAFLLTAKLLLLFILIFWEKKVKAYTIKYMYIYGKSSFNDYQGNDECHKALSSFNSASQCLSLIGNFKHTCINCCCLDISSR